MLCHCNFDVFVKFIFTFTFEKNHLLKAFKQVKIKNKLLLTVFPAGVLIIMSVSLDLFGSWPKLYICNRQSFNQSLLKHLTASTKNMYVCVFRP